MVRVRTAKGKIVSFVVLNHILPPPMYIIIGLNGS